MAIDTGKVIVGAATLYIQPFVAGSPPALPADSLALGSAWLSPWTAPGATQAGVEIEVAPDINRLYIEEQATPAVLGLNRVGVQVKTALAEDTLENMKTAYGGGVITTTAAATGQVGKKDYTLPTGLQVLGLGLEGVNPFGFWRRILIPKVMSVAAVGTPYRRAEGYRVYPVTFEAISAPNEIHVVDMTAVAL